MIDANDQFFKSSVKKKGGEISEDEKDRIWLHMTDKNNVKDELLVAFLNETTEAFDPRYDANYVNFSKNINFYSQINEEKIVIQALGSFTDDKMVDLGFDTKIESKLILGIGRTEGNLKNADIYLVDNLLNITHDLGKSDYEFEQLEVGEFKNRFTLQFVKTGTALNVDDIIAKEDFVISNMDDGLMIRSKHNVESIRVYDIVGRQIINKNPNESTFELKIRNVKIRTVLLIEAILENGAVVNRKTMTKSDSCT